MNHPINRDRKRLYPSVFWLVSVAFFGLGVAEGVQPTAFAYPPNFSEFVTFGDSLTHNDFLGFVYGNPQDMYAADPFEAVFDQAAIGGDDLSNYAVAGSTSDDLADQVDFYDFQRLIGSQDDATLVGLEIGGNDILDNVNLLAAHAPGTNANADAVIDRLMSRIRSNLLDLHKDGANGVRYILWTLPDITYTPRYFGVFNATQEANIRSHTQRANRLIRAAGRYSFVLVFDLYKAIQVLAVNPPTIKGHQLHISPAYGEYDAVFADEIHPTAVSNALLANAMILRINTKWNDTIPFYTENELAALAKF